MCLQTHSMRLLIILKTENEDAVKNIAFWNAAFIPNENVQKMCNMQSGIMHILKHCIRPLSITCIQ